MTELWSRSRWQPLFWSFSRGIITPGFCIIPTGFPRKEATSRFITGYGPNLATGLCLARKYWAAASPRSSEAWEHRREVGPLGLGASSSHL